MSDLPQANPDSEVDVTKEFSRQAVGSRWYRHRSLLMRCFAVAAVIAIVVTFLKAPDNSVPAPNKPESEIASDSHPSDVVAEPRPTVSPPRPPAIALASVAIPATAEQLQQEGERVANDLRDRF